MLRCLAKRRVLMYTLFMQENKRVFCGFPPVFDENSKILILGSFPSVKSREVNFYYGNKQNRFWKILSEFYATDLSDVDSKKKLCYKNNIALWDIVQSCEINGSMDADIKNFILVDLSIVLKQCKINKILCNGAKAYELTKSCYDGELPLIKMPSTSPANVRFDKTVWFNNLKLQ